MTLTRDDWIPQGAAWRKLFLAHPSGTPAMTLEVRPRWNNDRSAPKVYEGTLDGTVMTAAFATPRMAEIALLDAVTKQLRSWATNLNTMRQSLLRDERLQAFLREYMPTTYQRYAAGAIDRAEVIRTVQHDLAIWQQDENAHQLSEVDLATAILREEGVFV